MAKFKYQYDSSDCICPYCKHRSHVECEDYDENGREEKCEECGKKFHYSTIFTVDHNTDPDCALNGEEHQWEPNDLPDGVTHDFCSVCNRCRPIARLKS